MPYLPARTLCECHHLVGADAGLALGGAHGEAEAFGDDGREVWELLDLADGGLVKGIGNGGDQLLA